MASLILDPHVAKAVEWTVFLRSGEAGPAEWAAYDDWRSNDPGHEAAAQKITRALGPLEQLRRQGVPSSALKTPSSRASRRAALRSMLAVGAVGTTAGFLGWQGAREYGLLADRSTGTAERKETSLPDGSTLLLDARTAVDLAFDQTQRTVTLRHGRMLVDALAQPDRPLLVRTPFGQVQANGARFVARADSQQTQITVLGGNVTATCLSGDRAQVSEGSRVCLQANSSPIVESRRGNEALWTQGLVALDNEPLAVLVAALQTYRPGMLRIDPKAAQIRISGVFSLDDTDSTLRALAQTQPVHIIERTRYWVTISAA